jgi:hypothetical protein
MTIFFFSRLLRVLKWTLLFDERRDLNITGRFLLMGVTRAGTYSIICHAHAHAHARTHTHTHTHTHARARARTNAHLDRTEFSTSLHSLGKDRTEVKKVL